MNCTRHHDQPAVAVCSDCGKGLCAQCAGNKAEPLCPECRRIRRRVAVVAGVVYLVSYALLFYLGHRLNFLSSEASPDQRILSGYLLMAAVSGWQFINSIMRWRLTQASVLGWCAYGVVKLLASIVIGIVTAPVTVVWNIVRIIANII